MLLSLILSLGLPGAWSFQAVGCTNPTLTWEIREVQDVESFFQDTQVRRPGTRETDLRRWNSKLTTALEKLAKIQPIQNPISLSIPSGKDSKKTPATLITVQKGETLAQLAARAGVPLADLKKENKRLLKILDRIQDLRSKPTDATLLDLTQLPVRARVYSDGCQGLRDGIARIETAQTITNLMDVYVLVSPNSWVSSYTARDVSGVQDHLESVFNTGPRAARVNQVEVSGVQKELSFQFRVVPFQVDADFEMIDMPWFFQVSQSDTGEIGASGARIPRFPVLIRKSTGTGHQGNTTYYVTIDDRATDPLVIGHEIGHVLMMMYRHRNLTDLVVDSNSFDHATGGILASPSVQSVTQKNMDFFAQALPLKK